MSRECEIHGCRPSECTRRHLADHGVTLLEMFTWFRYLVRDATVPQSSPDDPSGVNTVYLVDQEQLLKNIESEIETLGGT